MFGLSFGLLSRGKLNRRLGVMISRSLSVPLIPPAGLSFRLCSVILTFVSQTYYFHVFFLIYSSYSLLKFELCWK